MTTSSSFGIKLGRGIGYAAAATVHGASVAVTATGKFGADVVTGTSTGYTDHSERLAAIRAGMTPKLIPSKAPAAKAPRAKTPVSGPKVAVV